MEQCADHVDFQLSNETTRINYLLDAIECSDAPLQAKMTHYKNDQAHIISFDSTAAPIISYDPLAKKLKAGIKTPTQIYVTEATSLNETKAGFEQTDVELRWHTKKQYKDLSKAQSKIK